MPNVTWRGLEVTKPLGKDLLLQMPALTRRDRVTKPNTGDGDL